jgi:hypothetical protein
MKRSRDVFESSRENDSLFSTDSKRTESLVALSTLHHTVQPISVNSWSVWTGFLLGTEQIENSFVNNESVRTLDKVTSLLSPASEKNKDDCKDGGFIDLIGAAGEKERILQQPFKHCVTSKVDSDNISQQTADTFPPLPSALQQHNLLEYNLALEGLQGIVSVTEHTLPVTLSKERDVVVRQGQKI